MEGSRWRRCSMLWGSDGLEVHASRGSRASSWSQVPGDDYRGDDGIDWLPGLALSGFSPFCIEVFDSLLDITKTPRKPQYTVGQQFPLILLSSHMIKCVQQVVDLLLYDNDEDS